MARKNVPPLARWIPIGVAVGAGAGVALHNIPIGVGLGVALGAALGAIQTRKAKKDPELGGPGRP